MFKGCLEMIAYIKYVAPVCVRDIRYPGDVRYLERSSTYHLVAKVIDLLHPAHCPCPTAQEFNAHICNISDSAYMWEVQCVPSFMFIAVPSSGVYHNHDILW